MLHFPPNYLFSQKKVEAQTSMNPHYHWVLVISSVHQKLHQA